ncbi:MAG: MerR family transcriptional regulator [Bacillati bacterium ANGP1]|uniref:MerR family transcriptional regulator n=1 Tax=Candidatus Segetimicrobium genomatis TaxID=2569760 RepID=A0A537JX15_9BACT|nr:MAG: MerR family transcriptional regulator [Terrabacteria group bacterium ANGP1]
MNAPEDLPVYPIRTAAALTGVAARRIRSWEVEYRLLRPARTKGGHRLYSTRDIGLIRRIRHLMEAEGVPPRGIKARLETQSGARVEAKAPDSA